MGLPPLIAVEAVGAAGVAVLLLSCQQPLEFPHTMGAQGSLQMCHPSPALPEVSSWFRRVSRAQMDTSTFHGCVISSHVEFYLL